MERPVEEIADQLRDHGLRATTTRVAVLRAVGELSGHPDTDTIATRVRESLGTISTQAVYDGLHAMTRVGLLRRIEPAGSPARYETRVGDNHHHLVCRLVRRDPRHRLRRRRRAVPHPARHRRLPRRRGGGHVLGRLSDCQAAAADAAEAGERSRVPAA